MKCKSAWLFEGASPRPHGRKQQEKAIKPEAAAQAHEDENRTLAAHQAFPEMRRCHR